MKKLIYTQTVFSLVALSAFFIVCVTDRILGLAGGFIAVFAPIISVSVLLYGFFALTVAFRYSHTNFRLLAVFLLVQFTVVDVILDNARFGLSARGLLPNIALLILVGVFLIPSLIRAVVRHRLVKEKRRLLKEESDIASKIKSEFSYRVVPLNYRSMETRLVAISARLTEINDELA